ncbi:BACON domain-containing protein [Nitrospira sp. NS4]|uniref:BACON domain-containing protein n=1 Tax=Nitrospira sp. NS4 TaxID=3414498 RepID=UPI003C2E0EDF
MNLIKAIAAVLMFALWSSTAWSATLTWNANTDSDLAGYRVYQCSLLPCSRASGNASTLATLGPVTSYNVGTPSAIRYFFVTAYDVASNESGESSVMTYTPPTTAPVIGVSPTSFSFSATQGGANPASQTLNISNAGGGTLTWSASENASWLTVSPTSGSGNGSVTLSVTTGSLAAGSYSGTITISATGATSVTVPVAFTVTTGSTTPRIGVMPTSLSFGTTVGGPNPASQTLSISNTGGGTLSWWLSDNATWLTVSPNNGTGNGTVTVTVSASGLAAGTYYASITIGATGASNVTVPVTFNISSSSTTTPRIGVSPTSLTFIGYVGDSNLPSQTLSITNTGGGTLTWSLSDNVAWLKVDPTSGTGNRVVGVTATPGYLAAGTYYGNITISATGATSVTVPVTMTVRPR